MRCLSVSVVIPCFNSPATLPHEVEAILEELGKIPYIDSDNSEIVLVADGILTARSSAIREAAETTDKVRVVVHLNNYGEQASIQTGMSQAKGDVIVTMDDDGQHNPINLSQILDPIWSGKSGLVYAVPNNSPHGYLRRALSSLAKQLLGLISGLPAYRISSFRAISASVAEGVRKLPVSRGVVIDALLFYQVSNPHIEPVQFRKRIQGSSGYSALKLLQHASDLFFSFPSRPSQFLGFLGFLGLALGAGVLGFTGYEWAIGGKLPSGYATLIGLIAVLSGIQLTALAIISEYVARLYGDRLGSKITIPFQREI